MANFDQYQQQWPTDRGIGTTTEQMRKAPQRAVFVTHPSHGALRYCRDLSRHIGRGDLEIQPSGWLKDYRWRGRHFTGIVVDHDVVLSEAELRGYENVMARVRPEQDDD